jgi:hypothetical protein
MKIDRSSLAHLFLSQFEKIPTETLEIPTLIHTFSPTGGKKGYLGEKPQIGPFTNYVLVV